MATWKRRSRSLRRFRKIPRRAFGMVKTNWRCGTLKLTLDEIQSAVWRTFRWWQDGQ